MKLRVVLLAILATTLVLYLPVILNPEIILNRGNDLQEFYWPIFYFIKENLLQNHTIPLWNNMFFSGTPLLSDPGSFLFYLPNIILLILPIDYAFIVSLILHTFFAGLGAYLVARKGFCFSQVSSVVTAIFYITFPRTAGFLESGHFVFVTMTTWLPYLLLAIIQLVKSPNFSWSILLAVSLSGLFFSFTTVFVIAAVFAVAILATAGIYLLIKNHSLKTLIMLGFGIILTIGLTSITLFPQIEWLPQTTRFILLKDRDVYPKWNGKIEFIKAMYPQVLGRETINELDTEKWITPGVFLSTLALMGFYKLKKKYKLPVILLVLGTVLFSLNNVSPLQSLLLSSDWYVLSRVSTRVWFIIVLTTILLAGFGFETLRKGKRKKLALTLAALAIVELLILSWMRLEKPLPPQKEKVPTSLYEFLKSDTEYFRVFCVNRCLSQQDVAKYNLQTIEGYGTIYQKNYYDYFIQLSQVFWDKYTSMLPPPSVYNFREIQPIASILGDHNVKYVISPYKLTGPDFKLVKQFDKLSVFENILFKPRAYFIAKGNNSEIEAPILYYSPNKIIIDTSKHKAKEVVFAETWSSGWKAKTSDGKEIKIAQTHNKLRSIEVEKGTQFIEMYYNPRSYQVGRTLSLLTLFIILTYFALPLLRRKKGLKRTSKQNYKNIIPHHLCTILFNKPKNRRKHKKYQSSY